VSEIGVPAPELSSIEQHQIFAREQTDRLMQIRDSKVMLLQGLFELGIALIQRNQAPLARVIFEDSLAIDFEFLEGWLGLGHAAVQTGAIQLAGHCVAKAEGIRPNDERVKELYSGIREIIGG
jgi:Tfp pilus assembly protein PilF